MQLLGMAFVQLAHFFRNGLYPVLALVCCLLVTLFSFQSCFAENLEEALKRQGITISSSNPHLLTSDPRELVPGNDNYRQLSYYHRVEVVLPALDELGSLAKLLSMGGDLESRLRPLQKFSQAGQASVKLQEVLPANIVADLNAPARISSNCWNTSMRMHGAPVQKRNASNWELVDWLEYHTSELGPGDSLQYGDTIVIWSDEAHARTPRGLVHSMEYLGKSQWGDHLVLNKLNAKDETSIAVQAADDVLVGGSGDYPDYFVTVHRHSKDHALGFLRAKAVTAQRSAKSCGFWKRLGAMIGMSR